MKPGFAGMGPQRDEITLGKTRYHKAPNPDVLDMDLSAPGYTQRGLAMQQRRIIFFADSAPAGGSSGGGWLDWS